MPKDIEHGRTGQQRYIQSDVIHMSFEEPPWLWSESTWPLSSALSTPRAPLGLSIQTAVHSPNQLWDVNHIWPLRTAPRRSEENRPRVRAEEEIRRFSRTAPKGRPRCTPSA